MSLRRRRLILVVPAVLGLAMWGGARAAAADARPDVFTVRDVAVDTTAKTAAEARDKALLDGQRQAFGELFDRLVPKAAAAQPPKLGDADITNLVEGFEVEEEKNSTVRYIAKLSFRFKARPVEDLLRADGLPFALTPSRPVLVLPVLRADGTDVLWQDPNPWRVAWAGLPPAEGLVPFVNPIDDLKDIGDVTTDQAVKGDAAHLAQIAQRYNTESVLVVIATARQADNRLALDIAAVRYDPGQQQPIPVDAVQAKPDETPDQFYARAAGAVEAAVAEHWKHDNLLHFDHPQEITVSVPLASLEDWVKIDRRLSQIAFVSKASLLTLSRREAKVDVQYMGDPDQLKHALAQNNLSLSDSADGPVLQLTGQDKGAPAQ